MKLDRARSIVVVGVVVAVALVWGLYVTVVDPSVDSASPGRSKPVPVEVSPIRHGGMALKRTFSGTIDARAQFVVAPKVSGRVEKLYVNLADTVTRGQVVAELDNDEYLQAVAQAEADLEVARANLVAAKSALQIANRELARFKKLRKQGIATDTQFDVARANQLAKQAEVSVAQASLRKAESVLETSKIQLGYTQVTAEWDNGQEQRIVAERFIDEGGTVAENASLLRVVELDPVTAVIFVTEKGYANLQPGQSALLMTDAYPGEEFPAHIERIAPVFREATRQARVELSVDNPRHKLKPGMFVRATVVLQQLDNAISVPELALTVREGQRGVFVVNRDKQKVSWRPVKVGFSEGEQVRIQGEGLHGDVVTLGQQFLDDGSLIKVVE